MRSNKPSSFGAPRRTLGLRAGSLGLLLALGLVATVIAQEEKESGKIVLDIPIRQAGNPEDSKEHTTIVVRGMMKSRSGAT